MTENSKHTKFGQLKKRWGLAADAPLEELLKHVEQKLQAQPDHPELMYLQAELLRETRQTKQARQVYKQTVKLAEQRTRERVEALQQRLEKRRDHTRARFLLFTFVPLIVALFAGGILWESINKVDNLPLSATSGKQGQQGKKSAGQAPEFAFTQWLAKQQMVQIVTTLQEQNPELSFDFSRASSANSQTPMEFMQSLMQPGALSRLRKRSGGGDKNANGKEGNPIFRCSLEPPVNCAAEDIPSAPGEKREEVVLLMDAYRSILSKEKNCEKLEQSIHKIGNQLSWRKSEYKIKADMEDFATECFFRQKNWPKTIEHARKLQCTGDPTYINSIYWYLTAVDYQSGNVQSARTKYQCFQEATRYIEKYHFKSTYVAARHRESGALAWLYFDDLETATSELEKARAILKREKEKTAGVLQVMSEIDLDLMETYVTANIDLETFHALHEEINSSGLLTDGYKQIKDTLAGIYYMQNHNNREARIALTNVAQRFKLMPEYICGWDWSGFRRGLQQSIPDEGIRKKAETLVDATNCYLPKTVEQRIQMVNSVLRELN